MLLGIGSTVIADLVILLTLFFWMWRHLLLFFFPYFLCLLPKVCHLASS